MTTIFLLCLSNLFMAFAWYGHLKFLHDKPLWAAVLLSWGIAFFEYCLMVPANRLGYHGGDTGYRYAANWLYETLETGEVDWLPSAPRDWAVAAKLMVKSADQQISFTDCLSFALMKRERIRYVFTFDRHFSYAGFQRFPERDFAG